MYIYHLALCPQITYFDLALVFSFVSSTLPPTSPAPIIAPFIDMTGLYLDLVLVTTPVLD